MKAGHVLRGASEEEEAALSDGGEADEPKVCKVREERRWSRKKFKERRAVVFDVLDVRERIAGEETRLMRSHARPVSAKV